MLCNTVCHSRGVLHHISGRTLYISRGDTVFSGDADGHLSPVASIPVAFLDRLSCVIRPLARLRRRMIHNVMPHDDRIVVMAYGRIWCFWRDGRLAGSPVPIEGSRPLALCSSPFGLFYGEYRNNAERAPIRLFNSEDGLRWRVAHTFEHVRHIHSVFYDHYSGALWVATGDADQEAAIWRSEDGFRTAERVVHGSQQTRAIAMLFAAESIYFGSDTPNEANHLYRYDRVSGNLEQLAGVAGSVFHCSRVGRWLLFSSAVEPSSVNLSRQAMLYASPDGSEWKVLATHNKDCWPPRLFQYGQLVLPSGENDTGCYWYSTMGVDRDYRIFRGRLNGIE